MKMDNSSPDHVELFTRPQANLHMIINDNVPDHSEELLTGRQYMTKMMQDRHTQTISDSIYLILAQT